MKFQLIAITPPYIYKDEAKRIAEALKGRFDRVHIRKPESTREEMVRLLNEIPENLRCRISLHDHHELVKQFGIGGIHLNKRNPNAPADWKGILSCSIHDPGQIKSGSNGAKSFDYVFLSPVFPSISKPGYLPRYTFEELTEVANQQVVALGGVTYENMQQIKEAGFGGAAMLTEAWRHPLDMTAFSLQFITHPYHGRSVEEGARAALEGGCRWIQLRHKDANEETLIEEAKTIAELCRCYGATFIIDDHVELARLIGADGVHLGKNDMPMSEARKILGPSYIIGATANTFAELKAAAQSGADYAGVGPFRFTTTKQKLAPVLGTEGYREIIKQKEKEGIRIPVVAIGGITKSDIPEIMATGVNGIAASGTILNSPDPAKATAEIIKTIKNSVKI